jgi:hypothetical protein
MQQPSIFALGRARPRICGRTSVPRGGLQKIALAANLDYSDEAQYPQSAKLHDQA